MVGAAEFATTRPHDLLTPGLDPEERRRRIETLYLRYGMPVRYYLLRTGCASNVDEAEELAHAFFARVCEAQLLEGYRKEGRFRAYLKKAVRHFAINERLRATTARRAEALSLPRLDFEFDERWVSCIRSQAILRLEQWFVGRGELKTWLLFKAAELNPQHTPTHRELAKNFDMSEDAVDRELRRCRSALMGIVNLLVAETCATSFAHEEELAFVRAVRPSLGPEDRAPKKRRAI